ncbi:MAG TPA: ABC transporter substrate-binding protein [Stellaceae bacterium]|nr:ABC transporter substrate-binding protein [Stellaceae bacterium]
MAALGWQDERNIRFHLVHTEGSNEGLPALISRLVAENIRAIVATGDPAIAAAQRGAPAVPIIGITDDMAGSGLVASMAKPGGNTTGVSILASELDVKRLELLHELVPGASRIGILADPTTISTRNAVAEAARRRGLDPVVATAASREEVDRALDLLLEAHVGAVNVLASPILFGHHPVMIERLNGAHIPAIYQWPERVAEGAFAGYGPRFEDASRLLAPLLDRILRGTKAADLPVMQPSRFNLAVNRRTAKAIGIAIPQSLLLRADEVIE